MDQVLREARVGGKLQGAEHMAGAAGLHRAWAPGTRQAGNVRDGDRQVVCSGLMGNTRHSLAVAW